MGNVMFSCWAKRLIDNREKPQAERQATDDIKLPFTYQDTDDVKAFIGWDGFFVSDESVDVVALCRAYMEAAQSEASCGECFPCRVGTKVAAELLAKLCDGTADPGDLRQLRDVLETVQHTSKCQVGQTVPKPVLAALEHYADAFDACVGSGRKIPEVTLLTRLSAPCTEACPAHLDIPRYVEDVKKRRYLESSDIARNKASLISDCFSRISSRERYSTSNSKQ